MDKSKKLKRYRRKDYTHVVEFPVEIIGRDGVVRRFSFEESVRLYQRRIASADARYQDTDVVRAEREHCTHRIDQLRRSYFSHFGWPSVEVVDEHSQPAGRMAGEAAAFLRRCLADRYPDLHRFVISRLDTRPDHEVFFVVPPPGPDAEVDAPQGHFLLYIYRFSGTGAEDSRTGFFEFIKVLDGIKISGGDDLELLIAYHHTTDCGLILTGSNRLAAAPEGEIHTEELELSWVDEEVPEYDRLEEALLLVRRGLFEEALARFVTAYTEQNFQRTAYLGAAVIADILGRDEEAETAVIMGTRYFPGDPALQYHHALNRLRAGAHDEASRALGSCQDWHSGRAAVALLEGLIELDLGAVGTGRCTLEAIEPTDFGTDVHLGDARRWLLAQLRARAVMRGLAGLAALGCLGYAGLAWAAGAYMAAGLSLLGGGASALIIRGSHRAWHRQLRRQLRGKAEHRMNLTSTGVLSRPRAAAEPQ
jgi:hypothetical protein